MLGDEAERPVTEGLHAEVLVVATVRAPLDHPGPVAGRCGGDVEDEPAVLRDQRHDGQRRHVHRDVADLVGPGDGRPVGLRAEPGEAVLHLGHHLHALGRGELGLARRPVDDHDADRDGAGQPPLVADGGAMTASAPAPVRCSDHHVADLGHGLAGSGLGLGGRAGVGVRAGVVAGPRTGVVRARQVRALHPGGVPRLAVAGTLGLARGVGLGTTQLQSLQPEPTGDVEAGDGVLAEGGGRAHEHRVLGLVEPVVLGAGGIDHDRHAGAVAVQDLRRRLLGRWLRGRWLRGRGQGGQIASMLASDLLGHDHECLGNVNVTGHRTPLSSPSRGLCSHARLRTVRLAVSRLRVAGQRAAGCGAQVVGRREPGRVPRQALARARGRVLRRPARRPVRGATPRGPAG